MHFSTATLVVLSSLSISFAAPFANPQEDLYGRKVDYQIVNVGGDMSSSVAPEIVETVTQTVKSFVTTPAAVPTPVTVTVTDTPSSTPYSSIATPTSSPYSTPCSSIATPTSTPYSTPYTPAGTPTSTPCLPSASSSRPASNFIRRGLIAAGNPVGYARGYSTILPSVPVPIPTTPLAKRDDQWYSSGASTSAPLIARQWGGLPSGIPLPSSASLPSLPLSSPTLPLVGRNYASPTPFARRAIRNRV